MNLRKDDPLYYKQKLKELLVLAEENNIHMFMSGSYCCKPNDNIFINFEDDLTRECATVKLHDKYLD